MAAHSKENRTEKEKAADEARKAWWTDERKAEKAKERAEQNKQDWFRQLVSDGCRRSKRSGKLK